MSSVQRSPTAAKAAASAGLGELSSGDGVMKLRGLSRVGEVGLVGIDLAMILRWWTAHLRASTRIDLQIASCYCIRHA
jgi:hypothetical protein